MSNAIAELNDRFRTGDMSLGQYNLTQGVQALPQELQQQLIQRVREFEEFNEGNDPYCERDFGKVTLNDESYFWKIEYYDLTLTHHQNDPANPNATRRVLMLMRIDEYQELRKAQVDLRQMTKKAWEKCNISRAEQEQQRKLTNWNLRDTKYGKPISANW